MKIKRRGSLRQFKSKQTPIVVRVENIVGIRHKGIRDKNIKKQHNVPVCQFHEVFHIIIG